MTNSELYYEYWVNKLSYKDLANKYGRSICWVQKHMKRAGIKSRSPYEALKLTLKPVIGKKFGRLTVTDIKGNKRKNIICACTCACGKTLHVALSHLQSGGRKSCGCAWRKNYEEMSGEYLGQIKRQAYARNLKFCITPQFMWSLFLKQERQCALSGISIEFGKQRTASLDRIDSSKGYTEDNVQWVHKDVNQMKMDLNQDYFLILVLKIANLQNTRSQSITLVSTPTTATGIWVTDPPFPKTSTTIV